METRLDGNDVAQIARLPVAENCEWVGGLVSAPFFITDKPEPWRPQMVLWIELPSRLVVGHELLARVHDGGALGRNLVHTMHAPMAGKARRPARIRVCHQELASDVRKAIGDLAALTVAPTPEIDEVVAAMTEASTELQEPEESYLEDGRIPAQAVAELFAAAKVFYKAAPWRRCDDDQVLRLDIPKLGVEGACVSIIGAMEESRGFIIFPSIEGFDAFVGAADELPPVGSGRVDLGTSWMSLNFERAADLPAGMRREVLQHGWETAGTDAYPHLMHSERDATLRPISQRDVQVAGACAGALAAFFFKHRDPFRETASDPICESYVDDRDLAVRITVPYEAHDEFDVTIPIPASAERKVARNAPCPCGSGKKYKKCCLTRDEADAHGRIDFAANHEMDGRLVRNLNRFAAQRFGSEWSNYFKRFDLDDEDMLIGLVAPWSVFHRVVHGRALTDWYLDDHARRLSAAEREWLQAQRSAWLSIWEVLEVRPGQGMTLQDLLSRQLRTVHEVSGSRLLVKRDGVLARIVDWRGTSVICGMHPHRLPPSDLAEVARRAGAKLRRKTAVPVERLRDETFGCYLIRCWGDAFHDFMSRRSVPPKLCNTDGDPLLFTTDHFDVAPAAHDELRSRLAAMSGVQAPEEDEQDDSYFFTRPGKSRHGPLEDVMVGRVWFAANGIRVESNSLKRADGLRKALEKTCGDLICHASREHVDPAERMLDDIAGEPKAADVRPAEAQRLTLAFKQHHYASWPDTPLPGLKGQTPREAGRTARGRADLDVLLKEMENHEQRMPAGERFDFAVLRRELGLDG